MWHIGIDLHRHTIMVAAVNDSGEVRPAKRFVCATSSEIRSYFEGGLKTQSQLVSVVCW